MSIYISLSIYIYTYVYIYIHMYPHADTRLHTVQFLCFLAVNKKQRAVGAKGRARPWQFAATADSFQRRVGGPRGTTKMG